jgi:hypothetical protein
MVRQLKKLVLGTLMLGVLSPGVALAQAPYDIAWDTFADGLPMGTASSKWAFFATPTFIGNDGVTTPLANGLHVKSSGTNSQTQLPAFAVTVPQEPPGGGNPGGFDHIS